MVYFRQERKWKNETIEEAKTFSEELPTAGVLDSILLTVRIYNSNAMYARQKPNIWDHITGLIVRSGGKENIHDVWGPTELAAYCIQYGRLPPGFPDTMSSDYQSLVFPILFGRWWKDPYYGLDLSKVPSPVLEIQNDFATADLQATSNIWFDIDLWFREGGAPPSKFIGMNQITSHTWTGASQEHTFKVPKTYPVRRIFLGCDSFRSDAQSGQPNKAFRNLRYLKYSYKSGGLVLRDKDDLYRSDQDALWGFPDLVQIEKNCEPRTGYTEDVALCRPISVVAAPSYSADPGADIPLVIDQRMERILTWRRATSGYQARLIAKGYGPFDHLCIHEDQPDDESGYLDPAANADVEVLVGNSSSGGSSGTIRFITQHVRPQLVA